MVKEINKMPQHLLAFSTSLGASAAYAQLNAVPDQLYTRQNNEYQIPKDCWCRWAAAMGTAMTACRIFTASLRLRGNPQIFPFNLAAINTAYPSYVDFEDNSLKLVKEENLRLESLHTVVGPDINRAFIAIQQDQPNENMNYKQGRWVRATTSVTTTAETWSTLGQLAFDDVLEGGSYAVYGMVSFEASTFASRLVFQNQYERPGSLALAALGNNTMFADAMTNFGLWGVFDTYSPPQLEAFSSATAAVNQVVWLYIAKSDGFQPPFRGQSGNY
jgi:hypothetical protein